MSTGTIIMIICAVLYGLIVILFKDDKNEVKEDEFIFDDLDDPSLGFDGSIGSFGYLVDDFDNNPPK